MDRKLQNRLLDLSQTGYTVKIDSHYVDGNAELSPIGDDVTGAGEVVYSSDVYDGRSLDEVSEGDVKVYKTIDDWATFDPHK